MVGASALLALFTAVGAVSDSHAAASVTANTPKWGKHPWPTRRAGDEWPVGLKGPFELREVRRYRIPSHDGTILDGWLFMPDVPQGVRVPSVLHVTPYIGQHLPNPDNRTLWTGSPLAESNIPVYSLFPEGYAVAVFSERGTGKSGGCFDDLGAKDRADTALLVNWLAAQEWSNERVGFVGISQMAGTAANALGLSPEPLKTAVMAGLMTDYYTFSHTPQGALATATDAPYYVPLVSLVPPAQSTNTDALPERLLATPERVCPDMQDDMTASSRDHVSDERNESFFLERRPISNFKNATAAVWLIHGFRDLGGHAYQEDVVWPTLKNTPKTMMLGAWGHVWPRLDDWHSQLVGWLDFWLKGVGDVPAQLGEVQDAGHRGSARSSGSTPERTAAGAVRYQDRRTGDWHVSSSWPPSEARNEVLYLSPDLTLSPRAQSGAATFQVATSANRTSDTGDLMCLSRQLGLADPPALAYIAPPAEQAALLAGNPFAYLRLSSSMPGGIVAVFLFALPPEFKCPGIPPERLAFGAADLRFHQGGFLGTDFPVGRPAHVRVDLTNFADIIPAEHRLAVIVSGPHWSRSGQFQYQPRITVHGAESGAASQVVIPVAEGTVGGTAPAVEYPSRPFSR